MSSPASGCPADLSSNQLQHICLEVSSEGLGHVEAQCFATVSGLNDRFLGNGVQQGLRYVLSCLVCVSEMSAQSAGTCINHAVLMRQLAQCVQVKSFNMCPLQRGIRNN